MSSVAPFYAKTRTFAKTGSGQTWASEKFEKKDICFFCRVLDGKSSLATILTDTTGTAKSAHTFLPFYNNPYIVDGAKLIYAARLVRKWSCFSHLCMNAIFLPRQARDKHRENFQMDRFLRASTRPTGSLLLDWVRSYITGLDRPCWISGAIYTQRIHAVELR